MSVQAVLLPVFVLVALTFAIQFRLGYLRAAALRSGESRLKDIALGQPAWPDPALRAARSFENQFELPVLFYVLVALALPLRQADLLFVILAWVFVVLRILHAYIHGGSNSVPQRFYAYLAGAIVLMAMWILFALKILLAV